MSSLLTVLHVLVCLFLMLTVLLQQGKGGSMGGAFGGGNAATVFGGSGASQFLRRLTAGAGTLFMVNSMVLAFLASHQGKDALTEFGTEQREKAHAKEEAKQKAIKSAGATSQGSAATTPTMSPAPAGSGAPTATPVTPAATGSAATPVTPEPKAPAPASTAPKAAKPATPAATEAKPAATETKPAATETETKPAAIEKPANESKATTGSAAGSN